MARTVESRIERDEGVRRAYSADASGLVMVPEGVARPRSAEEVAALLAEATSSGTPVTCAGGQTSTTGASITDRGLILSLKGMDRVIELDPKARIARVQPGVFVGELKRSCAAHGLLLAPDPTSEEECTVGGAVACNASGARSLRYGATRPHVRALRVALADGSIVDLRRPALEKNTVGYALAHDPVDWFIGSEGTLGVVVEIELGLLPLPEQVIGLAIPFATEQDAIGFVVAARESGDVHPRCLEFFDRRALAIAREAESTPNWAKDADAFVYLEEVPPEGIAPALDEWLALAEHRSALTDDVNVYEGESALREARRVRHAVPATMNERGSLRRPHGGRKVSTDWAVPYARLGEMLAKARTFADIAGIEQAVTYGHAGNGHPHQNFIAHDGEQLKQIESVVETTLREAIAMGGTVAAEHGIGKIKRRWLPMQMSPLQVRAMQAVKRELDPAGILAPGNVL
ncbi:MAG TPA: FAD-binding oxidoreductase [Gemmatimonadaceae bacterium]|jgi:FAD/FMN-containing dehydrogenase|nr:FAD-binding oxidoreductase [Gemmatimonadaceae bacterium]